MPLSYVTLGSNKLSQAQPFYRALMDALGGSIFADHLESAFGCQLPDGGKIWIMSPLDGNPATIGNGVTIGIETTSMNRVDAGHRAALASGGVSEGEPGPRPHYGPDFYGAYVRDPDGNKLALVHYIQQRQETGSR